MKEHQIELEDVTINRTERESEVVGASSATVRKFPVTTSMVKETTLQNPFWQKAVKCSKIIEKEQK